MFGGLWRWLWGLGSSPQEVIVPPVDDAVIDFEFDNPAEADFEFDNAAEVDFVYLDEATVEF